MKLYSYFIYASIMNLHLRFLVLVACLAISLAVESDINCLRSVKESLEHPKEMFSTWDFSNMTEGFICSFTGVDCWHADESRVLSIRLSDMGLRGQFPMGLKNCTSLTGLDLSKNRLTGHLPSNISDVVPYVTSLDLSSNSFSGPIPPSVVNCSFMFFLKLNNNKLTGQIPQEMPHRLNELSLANNLLSGLVPRISSINGTLFSAESYANNVGLCGFPLSSCEDGGRKDLLLGFAVGFPVSTILTMLFMLCFFPRMSTRAYVFMVEKISKRKHRLFVDDISSEESKVAAMEKYVHRLTLAELKMATNDFDNRNVIGYGNMGIMYKVRLPNGLLLAVKRLHKFENFETEFLLEIEILGRLRHTNLIPLLGFCFETEKKFLAYKYMSNGTLHQWLHSIPQLAGKKMEWPLRFKIAIGIARGLTWLHYNNVLRLVHLKVSSKCILLDENFEPKISNFGNSNILMNTSGVPSSSNLFKEDIYQFGILLLEMVSGKEPSAQGFSVIDDCLMGQGNDEEIYEIVKVAENCIDAQRDVATGMLQVYQAMYALGISRNTISIDSSDHL